MGALVWRFLGALLAVCVLLGSPLHCLAESLHKPVQEAVAVPHDSCGASHAPKMRGMSHCSSHVALLPSGNLKGAFQLKLLAGARAEVWTRPGNLLLQTQILVRDIGPPVPSAVLARQNLPLLICSSPLCGRDCFCPPGRSLDLSAAVIF